MSFVDLLVDKGAVFRIVGVSFYRDAVAGLSEGQTLQVVCEETNPHDPHAIRLETDRGQTVGYFPSDIARRIRSCANLPRLSAVVVKPRVFEDVVVGADIRLARGISQD